jgi:hypothetical protein
MTDFTALPQLELADVVSGLDEAVITIDGREEDQIIISCEGSLELADRLVRYVNAHFEVVMALTQASEVLRKFGAPNSADVIDALAKTIGEAA